MTNIEERLICLRGVGILAATPEQVLVEMAEALTAVTVDTGQTIFSKGEMGDSLYIIADGKVGIFDGPLLLDHHYPGDVFGEMAVLDSRTRSASAVAAAACRLYRLSSTEFRRLLSERSEVAEGVIKVLCERLRDTDSDRSEDYEYIRMVEMITSAAHDLEISTFRPESLYEVTQRTDPLGHLARVFQRMAREVHAREQRLNQENLQLRIEIDQVRLASEVTDIIKSDFFVDLEQKAADLRSRRGAGV
jgi:CRP-like cAMP-binding protein